MSHLRQVRNEMFNANGIRNTNVTVKKEVLMLGNEVITIPKHTAKLRNTLPLLVERTKGRVPRGCVKVRRIPHETHAGLRVHPLPYGAKWHQRGRHAR